MEPIGDPDPNRLFHTPGGMGFFVERGAWIVGINLSVWDSFVPDGRKRDSYL